MDILLPKQVLYQAELCPDTFEAQSLRASWGLGQRRSTAKTGTIRQHPQQSPEHVPTRGLSCSCPVRDASPPPIRADGSAALR